MTRALLGTFLVLFPTAVFAQGGIQTLGVDTVTTGPCGAQFERIVAPGASLRILRGNLPPNQSEQLIFQVAESESAFTVGTVSTDSGGVLQETVTLPGTLPMPTLGVLLTQMGDVFLVSEPIFVTDGVQPDTNGNGVADPCEGVFPTQACVDLDVDLICDDVDGCPEFPGNVCPTGPACSDGADNDRDGRIDFGLGPLNDPGCTSATDDDEKEPGVLCDDDLDNDDDGKKDFRVVRVDMGPPLGVVEQRSDTSDPACTAPSSPKEDTQCDNNLDDDGDQAFDWDGVMGTRTADPQCVGNPAWDSELVPEPTSALASLATLVALFALAGCRRRNR